MKRIIYRTCVSLAILLIFGLLIWLFTLNGTAGLIHIDSLLRLVFIIIGCLGLLLAGLAVWQVFSEAGGKSGVVRWVRPPVIFLIVLGFLIPAAVTVYVTSFPSGSIGNLPPRLILSNSISSRGVPDVAVVWNSASPQQETLNYQSPGAALASLNDNPSTQHVLLLRNLQPETEYSYWWENSPKYQLNVPSIDTPDLHFAVASDAHFGAGGNRSDLTKNMIGQIAVPSHNFDYFFSLGDLVDRGASNSQWQEALQAITPVTSGIPTGFAPGNHDTLFIGLKNYQNYCAPAGTENSSPDGSRLFYRVDVGKVHFLVLDMEWSAETYSAAQAAWLESQLQSIPRDEWKIVLNHGFYYASGFVYHGWRWYDNSETINALSPLFVKYGVDMVFSGHDHQMEYLRNSGVNYFINGCFGGVLDPEREYVSPSSVWYSSGQFGFSDITIDGNSATVVFRGPDFQELKSFTITRN